MYDIAAYISQLSRRPAIVSSSCRGNPISSGCRVVPSCPIGAPPLELATSRNLPKDPIECQASSVRTIRCQVTHSNPGRTSIPDVHSRWLQCFCPIAIDCNQSHDRPDAMFSKGRRTRSNKNRTNSTTIVLPSIEQTVSSTASDAHTIAEMETIVELKKSNLNQSVAVRD